MSSPPPTGSGKTLTAFLWALNAFAAGTSLPGATRVLYVSPLKALNNDIRRNLTEPLSQLREVFGDRGETFPGVRAATRSGDTPQGERQRLLRRPPEILITTPESLLLLLTTTRGRQALATVETVIVDEIHSIVENRRGASLMTSLERLVEIAGEFQRIALSATVRPIEAVARFVGGSEPDGRPRAVGTVRAETDKEIELSVRFPEAARQAAENGKKVWEPLSDTFRDVIDANRSTLFFANSRRLTEKITLKLNDDTVSPIAYAHHGSLSREVRTEVEQRFKDGDLSAIVATNSLEMGIDIGDLDEVVLVQSPPSLAASLQRIGRAGHNVGDTSRGSLFPTHARDFLEAAAIANAVQSREIEPLAAISNPLDVLAQVLVSMTASETRTVEGAYRTIRRAGPYETLGRDQFDLVVEMLAGRYAGTRIRGLQPRVAFDRIRDTLKARKSAVFALYNAGGTIPDRGYFKLRHAESGALIGELDEEFVWEASIGQTFTLGTQNWRVERITHNDVLVRVGGTEGHRAAVLGAPRTSTAASTSPSVSAISSSSPNGLLANGDGDALERHLREALAFEAIAAEELRDYLTRQREASGRRPAAPPPPAGGTHPHRARRLHGARPQSTDRPAHVLGRAREPPHRARHGGRVAPTLRLRSRHPRRQLRHRRPGPGGRRPRGTAIARDVRQLGSAAAAVARRQRLLRRAVSRVRGPRPAADAPALQSAHAAVADPHAGQETPDRHPAPRQLPHPARRPGAPASATSSTCRPRAMRSPISKPARSPPRSRKSLRRRRSPPASRTTN